MDRPTRPESQSHPEVVQFLSSCLIWTYFTLPPGGSDAVAAGEGLLGDFKINAFPSSCAPPTRSITRDLPGGEVSQLRKSR